MNNLIKQVIDNYSTIVRSEFHIQIPIKSKNKYIDLWPQRGGAVKVKLAGNQKCKIFGEWHRLRSYIDSFDIGKVKADLFLLRELEEKIGHSDGIYCDAGWKDGKAKISIVWIKNQGKEINLHISELDEKIEDNIKAELRAIQIANTLYRVPILHPFEKGCPEGLIIHSDCDSAVNLAKEMGYIGIKWLKRNKNLIADNFGNLRNQENKK